MVETATPSSVRPSSADGAVHWPCVGRSRREKLTVAVGLFAGHEALGGVVRRLARDGYDRMRMVAVLAAPAPSTLAPPASAAGLGPATAAELARHARTIVLDAGSGNRGWVSDLVTALAGTCEAHEPSNEPSPCPECGLDCGLDRHSQSLADQLRLGGAVLAVRVTDPAEQQAVCRVLLQNGCRGVQTHDLRRRA